MISWSDQYISGIAEIDDQHRKIFETINDLVKIIQAPYTKADLMPIFNKIGQYINIHFELEAELMAKYAYPDLIDHITAHAQFGCDFIKEQELLNQESISNEDIFDFATFIAQWIISHYMEYDRKLVKFLQTRQPGSKIISSSSLI